MYSSENYLAILFFTFLISQSLVCGGGLLSRYISMDLYLERTDEAQRKDDRCWRLKPWCHVSLSLCSLPK